MVSLIPIFVHQIYCFFYLLKNYICLKSKYTKKNGKLTTYLVYRKSQKISRKNPITVYSGLMQTRLVISSDEQITNCGLTDYYNTDFVRHGEIQGSSLVFFKVHCPCVLPSLT